jgi:tetratricopeptide (TPR) repeat protein
MTPEERAPLLESLARLAYQDAEVLDPLTTFLPLAAHKRALSDDVVVVLGGRGAGKTALFKLINDAKTAPRLRAFFETDRIPEATWIDAFSQASHHPEVGTLEQRAQQAGDITLRAFWMAHLLRRVTEEVPGIVETVPAIEAVLKGPAADLAAWLPAAEANLGAVNAALDAADKALDRAGRSVVATYDNLDRIGQFDPAIRRRYVSTLLALWLSLTSRYRRLRGKIFLRDDLFDAGELGFADATKLRPRSEAILWDHGSLFRVAVRHLAGDTEAMRTWLQEIPGLVLQDRGEFGWMPGDMPDEVQQAFAGRLAGKVIGKGVLKGYTSKWITGRLQDSLGRITPRSMLWFLGFAGEEARKRSQQRRASLVSPDDLLVALRRASLERVNEIKEEYDLVKRIENLRGMTIPLNQEDVVRRLGHPHAGETDALPLRGDAIFGELLRIGVLRARSEGSVDVPDIYRYSFDISPDYASAWKGFLTSDDRSAREQLERESPNLGRIFQQLGAAIPWSDIAQEELKNKDYAAARARCEKAMILARNAEDRSAEIEIWSQLGRISIEQQRPKEAYSELERAVALARRHDESKLFWALEWLAIAAFLNKRPERTKALFGEALTTSRRNNNRVNEAYCLVGLGWAEHLGNNTSSAIAYYKQAALISQDIQNKSTEFSAISALAQIEAARGEHKNALLLAFIAKLTLSSTERERVHADDPHRLIAELVNKLGYTPADVDLASRAATQAYEKDRGRSLLNAMFPDQNETPPSASS